MPMECVAYDQCASGEICDGGTCVVDPRTAEGKRLEREVVRRSVRNRMIGGTTLTLVGLGIDGAAIAYLTHDDFVSDFAALGLEAYALGVMGTGIAISASGASKAAELSSRSFRDRRALGWTLFVASSAAGVAAAAAILHPATNDEPLVLTGVSGALGVASTAWFLGSAAHDLHVSVLPTPGGAALTGTW